MAVSDMATEIFIIHGRDNDVRRTVRQFVDNLLKKSPRILADESSEGDTVVEKLERFARITKFAIALWTPDDVGHLDDPATVQPDQVRARQNVLFETGFFMGTIGRERVCILHKGDTEIISDLSGVVYIKFDESGDWQEALIKELEKHFDFDPSRVMKAVKRSQ